MPEPLINKYPLERIETMQNVPTYWVGILQGALEVLRHEGTVSLDAVNLPSATVRLIWKD